MVSAQGNAMGTGQEGNTVKSWQEMKKTDSLSRNPSTEIEENRMKAQAKIEAR